MAKEILFNIDARDQLKKGIDTLANARFLFCSASLCLFCSALTCS